MVSRAAIELGKVIPRGYWRLIKWAADRDPALWDFRVPLRVPANDSMRVDLRETVSMNFLRHGLIPGQVGQERLLRGLLKPGHLCFDVGANVGYTAIVFAALVGEEGRVIALEPGDRAFAILERNAADRRTVEARKLGASEKTGTTTFFETEMSDISSIVPVEGARQMSISTITLDDLAREVGQPDFVKIDVEGHEPAVFSGMSDVLAHQRPPIVLFEALTDEVLARCIAIINGANPELTVQAIAHDGGLSLDLGMRETADFLILPHWADE